MSHEKESFAYGGVDEDDGNNHQNEYDNVLEHEYGDYDDDGGENGSGHHTQFLDLTSYGDGAENPYNHGGNDTGGIEHLHNEYVAPNGDGSYALNEMQGSRYDPSRIDDGGVENDDHDDHYVDEMEQKEQQQQQNHQLEYTVTADMIPAGDDSFVSGASSSVVEGGGSPHLHSTNTASLSSRVGSNNDTKRSSNRLFVVDPNTPGRVVDPGQEHTGRWTREEHAAFLSALKMYGKEWKRVAAKVKTRTVVQTRTHAQKYFQKLQKSAKGKGGGVGSSGGMIDDDDDDDMDMYDIDMGTLASDSKKSTKATPVGSNFASTSSAVGFMSANSNTTRAPLSAFRGALHPPSLSSSSDMEQPHHQRVLSFSPAATAQSTSNSYTASINPDQDITVHGTTSTNNVRGHRPTGPSLISTTTSGSIATTIPYPVKASRRTSTATLSAAQVISTLSSSKVPPSFSLSTLSSTNRGVGPLQESPSMSASLGPKVPPAHQQHSQLPPPPRHGFSTTDIVTSSIAQPPATSWTVETSSSAAGFLDGTVTTRSTGAPPSRPSSGFMKIVVPDPATTMAMGNFPEPSPAATGKRKLDEIAAARMLAGVIGGVQHKQNQNNLHHSHLHQQHEKLNQKQLQPQYHGMKPPPPPQVHPPLQASQPPASLESRHAYNLQDEDMDEGPPTPPPPQSELTFNASNVPVLPFIGGNSTNGGGVMSSAGKHLSLIKSSNNSDAIKKGGRLTLQIVNPESLGVSFESRRNKGGGDSPVTPWDGQMEALMSERNTSGSDSNHNHNNADAADEATEADSDVTMIDTGGAGLGSKQFSQDSRNKNNSSTFNTQDGRKGTDGGTCHPVCDPTQSCSRSELHQFVCEKNIEAINLLLSRNSNEDNRSLLQLDCDAGYCPIHSACALNLQQQPHQSQHSLTGNVNNDEKTTDGKLMETAARSGPTPSLEIIRILLGAGADPNRADRYGNSPLHWASRASDKKVAELLLLKNCPLDSRNKKGETPLHWAMRSGMRSKDVLDLLLENGARTSILDRNFRRPLDVACEGFLDEGTSIASIRAKDSQTQPHGNRKKNIGKELKNALKCAASEKREVRAYVLVRSAQSRTLVLHHPECLEHHTKSSYDWEAPDRVQTIMNRILSSSSNDSTTGGSETPVDVFPHEVSVSKDFDRASLDLLSRVHSTEYLSFVNKLSKDLEKRVKENNSGNSVDGSDGSRTPPPPTIVPFTPMVQRSMIKIAESNVKLGANSDTSFSAGSLRAARRAAGAVQHAVDCVLVGRNRNAFCVVRPPGHHAGINGLLDGGESCGFCIFNNVAAGAMYAIQDDRLVCERCAIVDIDVHHGNGTEEIVRKCKDPSKMFFFSIHLYDNEKKKRNPNQFVYKFYPGTGLEDDIASNIINVPITPLWKDPSASVAPAKTHNTRNKVRSGETAAPSLSLDNNNPSAETHDREQQRRHNNKHSSDTAASENGSVGGDPSSPTPGLSMSCGRVAYRDAIRNRLLPALRAFNPDLILISAGFDAVKGDVGNARHEGGGKERMGIDLEPEDYAWTTRKICEIADICCQGRVVSVLEGGYGRTPRHVNNHGDTPAPSLDRSLLGECAIRHLHALIDPYDTENRYNTL